MRERSSRHTGDPNQLTKLMADLSLCDNRLAPVGSGRGGIGRAKKLNTRQKTEIAREAAQACWNAAHGKGHPSPRRRHRR